VPELDIGGMLQMD